MVQPRRIDPITDYMQHRAQCTPTISSREVTTSSRVSCPVLDNNTSNPPNHPLPFPPPSLPICAAARTYPLCRAVAVAVAVAASLSISAAGLASPRITQQHPGELQPHRRCPVSAYATSSTALQHPHPHPHPPPAAMADLSGSAELSASTSLTPKERSGARRNQTKRQLTRRRPAHAQPDA